MRFQNLSDVHTGRNAERVQHDFHGRAIGHVGHVFLGNNSGNDALVTVAACHLVSDGELALHGDVALHELDDARRKFVALLEFVFALFGDLAQHVNLARGHLLNFVDLFDEERILVIQPQALQIARGNLFDNVPRQLRALGKQFLVGLFIMQVGDKFLFAQQVGKTLQALVRQDADFVREVLFEFKYLLGFDGAVPLIFLGALAAENLHVYHGAFDTRPAVQRSVANISGFFTENGAQQLFFRRKSGFTLRRYFADQNISGANRCADADDAAFVQIAEECFADVGNIPGDFFGAEFRVASLDFIFLNVNRSVVVVLDELFAHQDSVFKVISAPGHERDQHVPAECEFAAIRARTVSKNLRLRYAITDAHQRF